MKNWLQKYASWIGAISLIFVYVTYKTRLSECLSESLDEVHYILYLKNASIRHGDIVLIQGHREDHVGEMKKWPYSKRVFGLPGDRILRGKDGIRVLSKRFEAKIHILTRSASRRIASHDHESHDYGSYVYESKTLPLLDKTSHGKPLTAMKANIIPEGYVFVAGDNPNSFDSRYEEFGLVPQQKIWGRAVWKW